MCMFLDLEGTQLKCDVESSYSCMYMSGYALSKVYMVFWWIKWLDLYGGMGVY